MYTANIKNLLDLFESELPTWNSTSTYPSFNGYNGKVLEDGKYELTLNLLGHNPKNIKLEVTETQLLIKSKKEESSSSLVKDIDLTLNTFKPRKSFEFIKTTEIPALELVHPLTY